MKLRHVLTIILAIVSFSCYILPVTAAAKDIVVGTDTSVVPFEYEKDGKMVGFDIDIWDAIAKEIGVTYRLQPMDFNGLIPALQSGNIDVALAAMTIRSKREEVVDFSHPYYDSGLMLMVRTENTDIKGPADVEGKIIAAKTGTTGADFAKTLKPKEMKLYANVSEAYLDLRAGRVDVAIHDTPNVQYYVKMAGDGKVKTTGPNMDAQSYGIAFPQGSPLREKVNIALLKMMEDGRYAEIYGKWFGSGSKY
jgi:glutamine transport system substrate-binding protein